MPRPETTPAAPRDGVRETLETIVFVVALVLMLKLFIVEAFVIPTGSMAETLFGYQKVVACPHCGHDYAVNSSDEVEPAEGRQAALVTGGTCPNCRQRHGWDKDADPGNRSGDRVLVDKAVYSFRRPRRGEVVVFKYPVYPQLNHTAQNYIKRLWGLGGETLAIYRGDVYVCDALAYSAGELNGLGDPKYPRPPAGQEGRLWQGPVADNDARARTPYTNFDHDYTYRNAEAALKQFEASRSAGFPDADANGFRLVRKPEDQCRAMRRIVYDNDHQNATLRAKGVPHRWAGGPGWTPSDPREPKAFTHAGPAPSRLAYAHRVPGPGAPDRAADGTPILDPMNQAVAVDDWQRLERGGYREGMFPPMPIMNVLGYNSSADKDGNARRPNGQYPVADLMLECEATVAGPADELALELSKGGARYQARFTGGQVELRHVGPGISGDGLVAAAPAELRAGRATAVSFSTFDGRLRVAVGGRAVEFGAAADLPPWGAPGGDAALAALAGALVAPGPDGVSAVNDIAAPASVVAAGSVTVSGLKLWQDTFFTPGYGPGDADQNRVKAYPDPADPVDTFFVHPGHYLCLGDNSGQSSDSRKWGLVPERLMLGRAQFVFFPRGRIGFIK